MAAASRLRPALLRLLSLLLGAAVCTDAVTTSASAARLSRLVVARDGSASLLLELLQGLRQETQAGVKLAGVSAKWCRNTLGQRKAMKEALQRQLSEAEAARRQLSADEARLGGEKGLLNSTVDEQEKRLKEADELVLFANKEFQKEQDELAQTLDAASTAIRLLRAQQADPSSVAASQELEASLTQLASQQLSDNDAQAMSSYLQSGGSKSDDLLQMLLNLRDKLEQDRAEADAEHEKMTHKLRSFADRLNSSILEGHTQSATVKTEAAQRKRERARLERKAWDLKELMKAADSSSKVIQATCLQLKGQKEQEAAQITAESGAVKNMLKSLPRGSWLAEGTPEVSAPSFLQVNDAPALSASMVGHALSELQDMAEKFPDEASWYEDSAKQLSAAYASTGGSSNSAPAAVVSNATTDEDGGDSNDALQDIQQFVLTSGGSSDESSADSTVNAADAKQVKSIQDTYRTLLTHVKAEESKVSTERSWCTGLLASAAADRDALKRSLKQVDAKLHMMDGAIADTEHSVKFNMEMFASLEEQSKQLSVLSSEAERQQDRFMAMLNSRARQLNDGINADLGQNDPKTSQLATELLRIMTQHEQVLQKHHTKAPELSKAVQDADGVVSQLLTQDAKQEKLRLVRLKSERQMLASQSRTRARALDGADVDGDGLDSAAAAAQAFCQQKTEEQSRASLLQEEERQLKQELVATGGSMDEA